MIAGLSILRWAPPYAALILLVPLAVAIWSWRSGTDADEFGLTVRAAVGRRRIPWSDIAGVVAGGAQVSVQLTSGRAIALHAVGESGVGCLVAVAGETVQSGSGGAVEDTWLLRQ